MIGLSSVSDAWAVARRSDGEPGFGFDSVPGQSYNPARHRLLPGETMRTRPMMNCRRHLLGSDIAGNVRTWVCGRPADRVTTLLVVVGALVACWDSAALLFAGSGHDTSSQETSLEPCSNKGATATAAETGAEFPVVCTVTKLKRNRPGWEQGARLPRGSRLPRLARPSAGDTAFAGGSRTGSRSISEFSAVTDTACCSTSPRGHASIGSPALRAATRGGERPGGTTGHRSPTVGGKGSSFAMSRRSPGGDVSRPRRPSRHEWRRC